MLKKVSLLSFLIYLICSSAACSGKYSHTLEFNPQERIRVAVLPFAQLNESGEFVEIESSILVDGIPLISSEVKGSPTELTRKFVYAELGRTSLDVVSPFLVNVELPHRGFAFKDGRFNLEKIFSTSASTYCTKFLDCDAVMFGVIRKWDRSYYGVQSSSEIEIELRLVAADTGKELFSAKATESDSRGLIKGPTGYSSIVLEPIRGLDSNIIEALARRTVGKMIAPLRQKEAAQYKTPPPAIYAASHDAVNGQVLPGKPLLVVVFANQGASASFSIGEHVRGVPMFETSDGHYLGEYWPIANEEFRQQPVTVQLEDEVGRTSSLKIDSGEVSREFRSQGKSK